MYMYMLMCIVNDVNFKCGRYNLLDIVNLMEFVLLIANIKLRLSSDNNDNNNNNANYAMLVKDGIC